MKLVDRIADALGPFETVQKRMFGGVCFMLNGNMLVGTFRSGMMARVAKADHAAVVKLPGASPMEMKGRVMEGFILITADAVEEGSELQVWIDRALAYNATLPAKPGKTAKSKKPR